MIIRAKNFLSWENLEFHVVNGVTLITGFNHDDGTPEGSGKSAILNALCWGLFGCIPKDANTDEVIREGSKGCEVEILIPEIKFSVFRSRAPNDLHMKFGEKIVRGKDARETQKKIEMEFGMSFETFCQSIYFAQNYQNKFVTANQENKGKILSEIQNLEQFDRARDAAAKRAKTAKEALAAAIKDVQRYEALCGENDKAIASYKELIQGFHKEKAEKISKLVKQLQDIEVEAETFVEQFEAAKAADLTRFDKELKVIGAEIKTRRKAHDELKAALDQFDHNSLQESYNLLEEESTDLENQRNDLRVKMGNIEGLIRAHKKNEADLVKARTEMGFTLSSHNELSKGTKQLSDNVEDLRKDLLAAEEAMRNPEKSNCPTCGQAWDGDISHYEKELAKTQKSYKSAQDSLKAHLSNLKLHQDRADTLKEIVDALEKDVAAFVTPTSESLKAQIDEVTLEIEKTRVAMKDMERKDMEYEAGMKQLAMLLDSVEQSEKLWNLKQNEKDRRTAENPLKQLEGFQKRLDALTAEVEAEDAKEPTVLEEKLSKAQADAKRNREALATSDAEKTAKETELIRLEALRDGYREVKAYTFQAILNQLTKKANGYLSELFEQPVKIKFENVDMKIDVQVTIDGKKRSLGLYSGGQARRIHLAVDLALSDITMSRKGNKLPIMIFDEYCKDLSEVSMEKVLKLLQARKGSTILIEHNSIFKSIVTNTFDVELVGGISREVA